MLARRGAGPAALTLLQQARLGSAARLLAKGWIAHCSPEPVPGLEAEIRADWVQLQQGNWFQASEQVAGACALALVEDDTLLATVAEQIDHKSRALEVCRVLLALGRLDAALPLIAQHGLWREGVGWSLGRLHLYEDAFMLSALRCLIRAERRDLVGRYGAGLVAQDSLMLGSISLRLALRAEDIAHAPAVLAVLPDAFLEQCFLGIAAEVPAALLPRLVPLIPRLSGGLEAIAAALLGQPDPSTEAAAAWTPRRRTILAVARRQPEAFARAAEALKHEHDVRRVVVGAVRCLRVLGAAVGDAERDAWIDRLEALVRQRPDTPQLRSDLLGELGSVLCQAGWRTRGEALLEEAVALADGVPKAGDQGWARNTALARVCSCCIQAEAWPLALRTMQRCTSKYMRENQAGPLAEVFARAGDFQGAWMIVQFAPEGRSRVVAVAQALLASLPGGGLAWWLSPRG